MVWQCPQCFHFHPAQPQKCYRCSYPDLPAATIKVACPACGVEIETPVANIGRKGRCSCGQVFAITPPSGTASQSAFQAGVVIPTTPGRFCVTCANPLHALAELCPRCGVRQPLMHSSVHSSAQSASNKRLLPCLLLWLFLGAIGAHAFYAGNAGKGATYVVLFFFGLLTCLVGAFGIPFWFPVIFIIGIIDLIYIVTGKYKDDQGHKITQWTD